MKIIRHILIFMLLITLLASGLQRFVPEDSDRNGRIDLSDVVLSVKSFAKTSQNFKQNFGKMVSAMYVAAGLKTVIQSNDTPATAGSADIVFLLSFFVFTFSLCIFSKVYDKKLLYRTLTIEPPMPVP